MTVLSFILKDEIVWRFGIYNMTVADFLMPVWHNGIGNNRDGKYRLRRDCDISYSKIQAFPCDFLNNIWICRHVVIPC